MGAHGHAAGDREQAQCGGRRRARRCDGAQAAHRHRPGDIPARQADAGSASRFPQGRDREVVAHHQGGEHQGAIRLIAVARNSNPADLLVTTWGNVMKLYEFAPTRSIRVRWTLQELGIDFEAIPVDLLAGEHRSPAFLKLNPAGKLPVLVDGEMVLTESIAIVLYLGEKYRDKGLIPADLQQRAQLMRWLLFTTTELEQPIWRMARHTVLYREDRRRPGELALAREDFVAMANIMDEHMHGRRYVVGDTATIGDFVLAYTLDWATMAKVLDGFPRLEAYMDDMYARPRAPMRIKEAFASVKR